MVTYTEDTIFVHKLMMPLARIPQIHILKFSDGFLHKYTRPWSVWMHTKPLVFTHYWNNIILQLDQASVVWCLGGLSYCSFEVSLLERLAIQETAIHLDIWSLIVAIKKIHRDRLKKHNNQSKQDHKSFSNGTCRISCGFSVSFKGDGDVHMKTSTLWCLPWTSSSQNEPRCLSALSWQSW